MSTFSFSGLGSGLDTNSIIDQLMALEKRPQILLQQKVATVTNSVSQFQALNNLFARIKTSNEALNLGLSWKAMKATTTDPSVTASATSSALAGSLSFAVKNLASAETLASSNTVSNLDTVVASGSLLFGQASAIGISSMKGNGLTAGDHSLVVTQASKGATVPGQTPVADSVTFDGTETLGLRINGAVTTTFTMAAGTYNQQQLAEMIGTVTGGLIKATVEPDKTMTLSTTAEGSANSLRVQSGTAMATLGHVTSGTKTGTNGIITVDGVVNTLTNVGPGTTATLNGTDGATIDAGFSGGLRAGSVTAKSVSLGDGKLSSVINAINAANVGVTAAAVQVAPDQFKLQLTSNTTGVTGKITTDLSAFTASMGTMGVVQEGKDAKITMGSGPGAYDVVSSTNTFSNVVSGVTFTVSAADPAKTITLNTKGDAEGMADKVGALITNINQTLSFIKQNSAYDPATKKGGALLGDSTTSKLQMQLYSAITGNLASSPLGYAGAVGIKAQSDGTFMFDRQKFIDAYNKDSEAVASAFVEGGTTGTTTLTKPGIAEMLQTVTKFATDAVTGAITTAISGRNRTLADLNKQITDWDSRLTKRQATLKLQFTTMETAISNLKSQQSWLAGQINGLASYRSS